MATHGSAAAALLKAALPKNPVASTSNTPDDWKTGRGGGARMSIRGRGVGRGRIGGDTRRNDDDVGMDVDDGTGTKRRGRTGARPSPMGDRVSSLVFVSLLHPRAVDAFRVTRCCYELLDMNQMISFALVGNWASGIRSWAPSQLLCVGPGLLADIFTHPICSL